MSERPAKIAFSGEDRDETQLPPDDDVIEVLDEDEAEEGAPTRPVRRKEAPKNKGVPRWIFAVGGGIILVAVIGGGWMAVSMKNRAIPSEEYVMQPQAAATPQPVIQQVQEPAVQQPPMPQPSPVGAAPSAAQTPAGVMQTSAAQAAPAAPSGIPQAQSVDQARIAVLEENLGKALAKLDDLSARLAKFEAAQAQKEKLAATAPVPVKPAPVAAPAKPATPAPAQKPAAKPVPPAKPVAAAPVEKPAEPVAKPPVTGYSISSIIGTRAWLVKRNSDGTETELSVAPGEKIEGKTVAVVDGVGKFVTLEGGQKIGVAR